ncbi:hypothetical protein IGB42_01763 [Andreprevotia sp. IGB-42]|nr:hypothetical protein IGB42_01763 [Andreprevotia sp. IGB-42]
MHGAAIVAALRGIEARFIGDEAQGLMGNEAVLTGAAEIRIQSAGNIQRDADCTGLVGAGQQVQGISIEGAIEADAEQAIDDDIAPALRHGAGDIGKLVGKLSGYRLAG